jgi:hypothetical protein
MTHNYIGVDELIYNNDGEIHSGGFSVNSIMLKNGLSPIVTLNENTGLNQQHGGEKVSDLFNNLVIPNWSLSYNYKNGPVYEGGTIFNERKYRHDNINNNHDDDDVMEEDLHEKLLSLVKVDKSEVKESYGSNKKLSKKNKKINTKPKTNTNTKTKKQKTIKSLDK